MHLLLQTLFKQKAETRHGIVAISFFVNGFAVAITRYSSNSRPRLIFCDFITDQRQNWQTQLEALVKSHRLEQYHCHIVLTHDHYRSFTIESPLVNPDEIKQAVHWRVAEMLDYSVDQAVIDSYPQPKSNRANRAQMLEVVSCNKALLDPLVSLCKQAGLRVKVVDIQETALRNLATLLPEDQQGVAILHLQPAIGHVIIEKQGAVYLSRKFDFNYRYLTESGIDDEQQIQIEQNNLALEIQRSFDYVENYFDIPPINTLAAVLLPNNTQGVINALMINHGITARAMDITAIVDVDIMLSDSLQNICAPVIGASLRWHVEHSA